MTYINTNVGALMARTQRKVGLQEQKYPWNAYHGSAHTKAADDVAGLAVTQNAESVDWKSGHPQFADGISLVQTARGEVVRSQHDLAHAHLCSRWKWYLDQ